MATASHSPLTSSVEKVNGAKLSRLLIDGGTTALRTIFDGYHPPANLSAGLNAYYSTLVHLFRKMVLRSAQWEKLFPTCGAAPDSNTFDITLLFLLLTNICGLYSPLSGWHVKPPPSDNSFEANLARVKFFRNELYGHLATTAIDTPAFSSLWQDISAVLVPLGLDNVAIERLKLEHSGEEDYIEILNEWAKSEEDIKSQLIDIQQSQTQTAQNIAELRQGFDEMKNTFIKSCETNESVENRRRRDEEDKILKALAMINTVKDVEHHSGRYQEGTRLSILTKVENWMDDRSSENRVLVISGKAGMGKSVISAVVCKRMLQANRLSGSHFCQHGKARHRNPKVMLQSLACQLSNIIPEFRIAIVEILSRNLGGDLNSMEVSDLFELLLAEPLSRVKDPGRNILMVIDGLDESEYQGRNELLDVIANHFCKLPAWVRFLVTTRPEINIADNLKGLEPLQLEPSDHENLQDIRHYINCKLGQSEIQEDVLNYLVEKSEGVMLFSYYLVDFVIKMEAPVTPELLENDLPSGISSVYASYFKRLENELVKELEIREEHFFAFLSAVTASREPLPVAFVAKLFLLDTSTAVSKRKFMRAISCISTLLTVEDYRVKFFHKSAKDWLTDTSSYGQHDFTLDMSEGHSILSKLCSEELDRLKHRGVFEQNFSDTETYSLQHGVTHMLEDVRSEDSKALVEMFVLDLELVCAKLCVDHAAAAEDIVCSQKQAILSVLPEEIKTQLDNLLLLLRKYHESLKHLPYLVLQTVLNEGEPQLSSQASYLLSTKYPIITFMEYLHKDVHEEAPKAAFRCSAEVVCFDVSPQSEYMVCECKDEMLYLWSLRSGKLEWKRPSKVKKQYSPGDFTYRTSPSSDVFSCYRSVVFHPFKEVVLPGTLRSAYSYDGDLKPLFPESNCIFTVCSLLNTNGEVAIVTDCPDDAKCIILWSLENGSQVANIRRDEDVFSFACSLDGRMLAVSHSSGSICLIDTVNKFRILAENTIPSVCGMIQFSHDNQFLLCWHESNTPPHNVYKLKIKRINPDTFSLAGRASC
ncbi:uncharacterized protein LOC111333731 [Stylophora pistillata]|uniref:uncharacterized protein LOC111333731 n=1 Tax=Stylophora pistillata TaxID=50429 RepID=UPI000C045266|nr:uncharacterized protein LOC111333731 [Stylophora pistillata]